MRLAPCDTPHQIKACPEPRRAQACGENPRGWFSVHLRVGIHGGAVYSQRCGGAIVSHGTANAIHASGDILSHRERFPFAASEGSVNRLVFAMPGATRADVLKYFNGPDPFQDQPFAVCPGGPVIVHRAPVAWLNVGGSEATNVHWPLCLFDGSRTTARGTFQVWRVRHLFPANEPSLLASTSRCLGCYWCPAPCPDCEQLPNALVGLPTLTDLLNGSLASPPAFGPWFDLVGQGTFSIVVTFSQRYDLDAPNLQQLLREDLLNPSGAWSVRVVLDPPEGAEWFGDSAPVGLGASCNSGDPPVVTPASLDWSHTYYYWHVWPYDITVTAASLQSPDGEAPFYSAPPFERTSYTVRSPAWDDVPPGCFVPNAVPGFNSEGTLAYYWFRFYGPS